MSKGLIPKMFQKYFNRFEIKYQISIPERDNLIDNFRPFMELDPHIKKGYKTYEVRSVYFDSLLKRAYFEKIYGIKVRVKLRIRYYPDFQVGENELVFIELKRKINDNVSKSRILVPFADSFEIIDSHTQKAKEFYEKASQEDREKLNDIWYLYNRYNLKPVCMVWYHRRPFISKIEQGRFRITFDTSVKVRNYNFDLHMGGIGGRYVIPPQICIMEIKFTNMIPAWAIRVVQMNNVIQEKMSKFASGLERTEILSIL